MFRRSVKAILLCTALVLAAPALRPLTPAVAKESCKVQIRNLNHIEVPDDYDPYEGVRIGYHQFEVQHQNGPGCRFMVSADAGSNGGRQMRFGQNLLDYELYTSADLSQPVASEGGPVSATFTGYVDAEKDQTRFTLFSMVPAGQLVRKGSYNDQIRFEVYELEDGVPTQLLDTSNTQVRARVREVVQATVIIGGVPRALAGTVGTVDLGELTDGGEGHFDLEVSGNGEFDLYLSSENGGELRRAGSGPGIPYRINVDGQTVDLRSSRTLMLDGDGQRRYSLVVSSQRVDQAIAGTYGDNLYLSVEAR